MNSCLPTFKTLGVLGKGFARIAASSAFLRVKGMWPRATVPGSGLPPEQGL